MKSNKFDHLLKFSATTCGIKGHLDILDCFLHSAQVLHAHAYDGRAANRQGLIGQVTDEVWNGDLITAFYLLRHSLELAVKALIYVIKEIEVIMEGKERMDINVRGHDINDLWKNHIPSNYKKEFSNQINDAFTVLEKHGVLHNEQLFRYHASIGKDDVTTLEDLPNISSEDFEKLFSAVDIIRCEVWSALLTKKNLLSMSGESVA